MHVSVTLVVYLKSDEADCCNWSKLGSRHASKRPSARSTCANGDDVHNERPLLQCKQANGYQGEEVVQFGGGRLFVKAETEGWRAEPVVFGQRGKVGIQRSELSSCKALLQNGQYVRDDAARPLMQSVGMVEIVAIREVETRKGALQADAEKPQYFACMLRAILARIF